MAPSFIQFSVSKNFHFDFWPSFFSYFSLPVMFTQYEAQFRFRFLRVYYWCTSNTGCTVFTVRHVFYNYYYYLPCCWASRKPISSVEFKFVARQVEASVVIRAAKLKFVSESRTRVYFVQHVASTCNTVFCCETSWSQT